MTDIQNNYCKTYNYQAPAQAQSQEPIKPKPMFNTTLINPPAQAQSQPPIPENHVIFLGKKREEDKILEDDEIDELLDEKKTPNPSPEISDRVEDEDEITIDLGVSTKKIVED